MQDNWVFTRELINEEDDQIDYDKNPPIHIAHIDTLRT
jgi:hypothetical protein